MFRTKDVMEGRSTHGRSERKLSWKVRDWARVQAQARKDSTMLTDIDWGAGAPI